MDAGNTCPPVGPEEYRTLCSYRAIGGGGRGCEYFAVCSFKTPVTAASRICNIGDIRADSLATASNNAICLRRLAEDGISGALARYGDMSAVLDVRREAPRKDLTGDVEAEVNASAEE